jgi:hypothetical protein
MIEKGESADMQDCKSDPRVFAELGNNTEVPNDSKWNSKSSYHHDSNHHRDWRIDSLLFPVDITSVV